MFLWFGKIPNPDAILHEQTFGTHHFAFTDKTVLSASCAGCPRWFVSYPALEMCYYSYSEKLNREQFFFVESFAFDFRKVVDWASLWKIIKNCLFKKMYDTLLKSLTE